MTFPTLYKRTANGQVQTWVIEVRGARYRTIEGLDGGVLTTSEWTECEGKNVGRANETSAREQAAREATSKHQKKIDAGYTDQKAAIDEESYFKPMLAKEWDDYKDDIQWPVYSSPKLDGLRCIVSTTGIFSRNGKPIVSIPHISDALKLILESRPELVFDGEIYVDKLSNDFNKIISLAKKTKPTEDDLAESADTLEYWVFDIYDKSRPELTYIQRQELLASLNLKAPIVPLFSEQVDNLDALDSLYSTYLDKGFEGQMVRAADSVYENKRSRHLLKRKTFIDEEFLLIDLQAGRGGAAHRAAKAILKTEAGDVFEAGIIGSHEYAADILRQKDKLIGKMATVVYQNMTPGDNPVPRFGKLKQVDREAYE